MQSWFDKSGLSGAPDLKKYDQFLTSEKHRTTELGMLSAAAAGARAGLTTPQLYVWTNQTEKRRQRYDAWAYVALQAMCKLKAGAGAQFIDYHEARFRACWELQYVWMMPGRGFDCRDLGQPASPYKYPRQNWRPPVRGRPAAIAMAAKLFGSATPTAPKPAQNARAAPTQRYRT